MRVGALLVHSFWQWLQITSGFVLPLELVVTSDQIGSLPMKFGREPFGGIAVGCIYEVGVVYMCVLYVG